MDRTLNAEISNLVVRLFSEHAGRGPTKARTYICEDLITTVLRDTLTSGERTLVAAGRSEVVRAGRRAYQELIEPGLTAGVQQLSRREVVAMLADDHFEPDISVVSIVLATPLAGE